MAAQSEQTVTLQSWVTKQGGASRVSRMLKMQAPRVQAWVRKEATPKPRAMQALVRLSKGELSLDAIIDSTQSRKRAKKIKSQVTKRAASKTKRPTKTLKA